MKHEAKTCSLCGGKDNLKGPYAGGPFPYLCEKCIEITHKYVEGHKKLQSFFQRTIKNRIGEVTAENEALQKRLETTREIEGRLKECEKEFARQLERLSDLKSREIIKTREEEHKKQLRKYLTKEVFTQPAYPEKTRQRIEEIIKEVFEDEK